MDILLNKVVIVTGAAGGIGKAIARLFLAEGAKVVATDLQQEKLEEWSASFKRDGFALETMKQDVSSEKDWTAVIVKTISRFQKIDVLVNNAGVYPAGANTANTSPDDWNKLFSINVTGPFIGTRLCLPYLTKAGAASIVNISSIAGIVGGNGPAYSASKAALIMLTKDQAVEFAKDKIRVNAILPGGVVTPMTDFLVKDPLHENIIKNMCPMERMGSALEIAHGAMYLASDLSSYVTGTSLVIDGGLTAR